MFISYTPHKQHDIFIIYTFVYLCFWLGLIGFGNCLLLRPIELTSLSYLCNISSIDKWYNLIGFYFSGCCEFEALRCVFALQLTDIMTKVVQFKEFEILIFITEFRVAGGG